MTKGFALARAVPFMSGVFALVALTALIRPHLVLPTAAASPPPCIIDGDYGAIGIIEDPTAANSDNVRGTRAHVWVVNGPTACQYISSVYVFSPTRAGDMEFGYVVGYSNCNGSTYSNPTLFWWSHKTTGESDCGVWGAKHPTEGQYDLFRVSDLNANTYWGSYWNQEELQPNGVHLDFTHGWSIAAMERGDSADGGYARYEDLNEYHDNGGWSLWNNLTLDSDQDPDYHLNRVNAYTGAFVR